MSRPLRILPAGCVAHALNRGVEKRALFDRVEDYEDFLTLAVWAKAKCTIRILVLLDAKPLAFRRLAAD